MARNKYSKMRADRENQQVQRKGQPSGIDVIVSDDNVDMTEEVERLWEEEAQKRVSVMQEAPKAEVEAEDEAEAEAKAKAESAPETKAEADTKSETKPKPEPKPQKDSEPKPMKGIVTEEPPAKPETQSAPKRPEVQPASKPASKPQPRPTVTPEQLRPVVYRGVEYSSDLLTRRDRGELDEAFTAELGKVFYYASEEAVMVAEARAEAQRKEAAKWKAVVVVKVDDKWRFFVDAYRAAATAIDAIPGIDSKMKASMKAQAREDLYDRAEARQRHCETGEVRRYESSDLAALKKEEWRDAWDAKQKAKKKNNPAGDKKPAK